MQAEIDVLSSALESKYLVESLNTSVSKHLLDEHFTLVAANGRYYEMFGYEKEEYIRLFHNRPDLFYADDPEAWSDLNAVVLAAIKDGRNGYTYIGRMRHKDGRKIWVKLVGTFIDEYVDGMQISYSVMMDITDLMQAKIEKDVTQNIFPGMISKYRVTDEGYEFIEGNKAFLKLFQNRHLSLGQSDINIENGLANLHLMHDDLRMGHSKSFTISPKGEHGKRCYLRVNAECIDWINNDPVYLLLYTDITDLTRQKQQLEELNKSMHKLAYSDEVTKGFNKRKFEATAYTAIHKSASGTYSMIWLNLQKFKLINDKEGIDAGDHVLLYIHDSIQSALQENEYVARLFSDNFIILLKENQKKNIEERLMAIVMKINSFNDTREQKYFLTFTAGVYSIIDNSLPVTTMEDRAHAARKAKQLHRFNLCSYGYFSEDIRNRLLNEKSVEDAMEDALKNGEFEVYLQPKYSLEKEKIEGAEALIRWNHPTRGFLPPLEFIPLFEQNGFIVELDLFVFEKVCQLIKKWIENRKPIFPISVNMSRVHFSASDFLDRYIEIRNHYEIPSEYLELELTETMVFENPERFKKIIQKIHEAGFSCSMDDFGSGYSSLNMLKDLELDTVKLDGAFFSSKGMDSKKENIIVRSMINLTKALNMSTVAEGIETMEQVEFLRNTPCDLIQGYVISKPITSVDFEKLLKKQENKS